MNDILKDKLSVVSNDEILLKAIRAVFDEVIDKEKPQVGETDDDIRLGQKTRAYEKAKKIIDDSFVEIRSYRNTTKPNNQFNKER